MPPYTLGPTGREARWGEWPRCRGTQGVLAGHMLPTALLPVMEPVPPEGSIPKWSGISRGRRGGIRRPTSGRPRLGGRLAGRLCPVCSGAIRA